MGCCEGNRLSQSSCEDVLEELQEKIGFSHLNSKDIDRVIHRFCNNLKMTEIQFEFAARELKIQTKDPKVKNFFKVFYDSEIECYCARNISLLGILLGIGTNHEKAVLLFENYDFDTSKTLEKSEIYLMLREITNISMHYLVSYASHHCNDHQKSSLYDYKTELCSMRPTIINYFVEMILENTNNQVTFEEFQNKLQTTDAIILIQPKNLRLFSKNLLRIIYKTAETVKTFLDEPDLLEKDNFSRRLTKIEPKKKKVKKTLTNQID